MRLSFHALARHAAVLAAAFALAPAAQAQAAAGWPTRQPVKIVAVFPPGGSVDQVARLLAPALQQQLGQSVVVENRSGASGAIGTGTVANGPADGYTFAMVFDTHAVNPALMPSLPFDTRRDLVPVALIGTSPMVLATHADSAFKSFDDVIAAAKARRPASYGTVGAGSLGHLAVALLEREAKGELTHVPYKGGGPLMQDALAGHVPLAIATVFLAKPHVDSGKLRALAVTSAQRTPQLPQVPTIAERGFAGFEAPAWWALLAPAKTPPEIVARMNEEVNKALRQPEVAAKLAGQGIVIHVDSPQAARAFIERQMDTWTRVVRDNGIKAE